MIYDTFTFSNELDLLELRLHELRDTVDFHVLVESTHTFSGHYKPLYYALNKFRFREFERRIIHVVVRDMPQTDNRWEREAFQRNAIQRGLTGTRSEDWVFVCDVDEIPKTDFIQWAMQQPDLATTTMQWYYYNLCGRSQQNWPGPVAYRFGKGILPNDARHERYNFVPYQQGAYHFSFFPNIGNAVESVQAKIHSFAHAEYDSPEWTSGEHIMACIETLADPFARPEHPMSFEPIGDNLPRYILDHLDRFRQWIPRSEQERLKL